MTLMTLIFIRVGFNTSMLCVAFLMRFLRPPAERACEVGRNTPTLCVGDSLTGSKNFIGLR